MVHLDIETLFTDIFPNETIIALKITLLVTLGKLYQNDSFCLVKLITSEGSFIFGGKLYN